MLNKNSKIYIAGHNGMVGSAILKLFKKKKYKNLITQTKNQLDLTDQKKTNLFLKKSRPEVVIIAAAKVGGIHANNIYRADFLYQNIQIQNNLIYGSYVAGVKKLIFLGSSCIYPKYCKQPIKEEYLLSSKLEYTNEPYAIAKIAGLKLIENMNKQYKTNYTCLMPCNLFGPNDNYDLNNSHFIPALIRKIYYAKHNNLKTVTLWGDGKPKRELMYVEDLALACEYFLKKKHNKDIINIGTGIDYKIDQYARKIANKIGYSGVIKYDKRKPNGTPRKLLDISVANNLGWKSTFSLDQGLNQTLLDYRNRYLIK